MKNNYKIPMNKKVHYILLFFLMIVSAVFAQTETEPNNTATASGTQRIWDGPTTITGNVSSTDPDYWNVSKLPGFDPQRITHLFFSGGYDPSTIKIQYEVRRGSYNGTVVSAFRDVILLTAPFPEYPSAQVGWYYLNNFGLDLEDNYVVFRITTTSASPVNYSLTLQSEDFPTCSTPADVAGLNVTTTGGDNLQLDAFSAVNGITGGYVVEISDSPTFSALPNPQFDTLTDTTPSTVYNGSGQQVIYASSAPNRLLSGFEVPTVPGNISITGLDPNVTYYFRVTTANECNGYFNFSNGVTTSGATFACDAALITPSQVTNIVTANNTIDSFNISSFIAPTGGANGYVIKINTTNSFTAPTDSDLTSSNTIYNLGAGEQVVYAGTLINPNITVNGTGVIAGTNFFVKVYAYNVCLGGNFFESIGATSTQVICNGVPTVVPSALAIDQISHSSMRINSTSGAGGAIGQVILINTINSFTPPVPGALPVANTVYSETGQQVIYVGSDVNPEVTVTNLTNLNGGTQYYFKSYAYNPCGTNFYFESTGVDTNATTCGAVQSVANTAVFFEVGDSFMDFKSFSPAAGVDGYVVKMNTVNTFSPPSDGSSSLPAQSTSYSGGEQVIYAGTSTTPDIRITGLSANTTYYFTMYSYTDCGGALFYEQTGYNFSKQNVNTPSNLTFNDFSIAFGSAAFDLNNLTSSLSPGVKTYTIISGGTSTGGSSLSGIGNNIMTPGNVGTVLVQVNQEAAPNFNSGIAQATIIINKAEPTITFNNQTIPFGSSAVTLAATSNSTGTISYSFVGDNNGNVLSGTNNENLTPGNAGTVTVRATVAEDANYSTATKDIFFSVSAPSEIIGINANGVFKVVNETTVSTLVDFTINSTATGSDGKGELLQVGGKLWGVTNAGGVNDKGTIFNVNTNGTGFMKVHDFNATTEGSNPTGFLTFSNGKIWGVLSAEGPGSGSGAGSGSQAGSIFSIDTDGTNFTIVRGFSFTGFTLSELAAPIGGLTEANGKLWGMTSFGGNAFAGGIYSINTDGTEYTEVYLFPSSGSPGQPASKLTLTNNKLWGVARSNGGSVFTIDPLTITPSGIGFSQVHRFGFTGTKSLSGLSIIGNQVFGIWNEGGANSTGVLYRVNDDGTNYTTLYDWPFTGPRLPLSSLTVDGGTLFGTTTNGGTNDFGTIYKIKTDGTGYQDIVANTATPGTGAFLIAKDRLTPSINFDNLTVEHLSTTTLAATSNSTGVITYSLVGDTTGSSINGDQFTAGNAGTVTARASLAQDANFDVGTKDITITIGKTNPTFTIADIDTTFGNADITLTPSDTNYTGGSITYQFVDPTDTNNLSLTGFNTASTISGATLTLGNQGTETIRATLAETANFNPITFDFQLNIGVGMADLSGFTDFTIELLQSDVTLTVPSAPGVTVDYQLLTSSTGASLSGDNNEILSVGNLTGIEFLRVTVNEPNYASTTKDVTLTVVKASQTITFSPLSNVNLGGAPFDLSATSDAGLPVTYTSSDTSVATVSGNTVTILGSGTTDITASQIGNETYAAATDVTQSLTVNTIILQNQEVSVTPTTGVCNVEAAVSLVSSQSGVNYYLRDNIDNSLIEVQEGTGSGISFTNETLTANKTYNVLAVDAEERLNTLQFDAVDGYVEIPNTINSEFSGNRITVETWAYIPASDNTDQYTSLITEEFNNNKIKYQIAIVNGQIETGFYNGSWTTTPLVNYPKDRWIHIASTYDQNRLRLYIDGVEVSTRFTSAALPVGNGSWRLGRRWDQIQTSNFIFGGRLAETRIWNVARTATEIIENKNVRIDNATGLVASYLYDETTGTTLTDKTGNGFDGTLTALQGDNTNWLLAANRLEMTNTPTVTVEAIVDQTVSLTQPTNQSARVALSGSQLGVNYSLRDNANDAVIETITGTGSVITFATETITADKTYNVFADAGTCNLQLTNTPTATFAKLDQTIDFSGLSDRRYGDAPFMLTATASSGLPVTFESSRPDVASISGNTVTIHKHGTVTVTARQVGDANYNSVQTGRTLLITRQDVYVTADVKTKVYGDSDPVLTYQITRGSLIGSDMFTGNLERELGENVGTYAINQGTLMLDDNYRLYFTSGDLSITARPIEVTADAGTKVEGESDPALTYQITLGSLVGSDVFTGTLERNAGEVIGDYPINQGTLTLGTNYQITFVGNTFTISRDVIARWDGNTNSTWNTATNWEGDITPLATDNYIIPNVGTTPNISSGVVAEMNSLTVEASSSLAISADGAAVIENNFDNSGTITITSTATESGALIVKGTANGMVTYERGGLTANQWSIISAPVSGQSIKEFAENPANAIRVNPTVTPNRIAIGYYDDSKPAGSKWTYYTTDDIQTNALTFEKSRSYIVSRGTDGAVTFTGTLETGNVVKSVAASQWNAVGNPYTAFMPINGNANENFLQDNLLKFDPVNVGVYIWDNNQNKYVANSLVSSENSLAPGQGFFMRTTTGVTDITFDQSQRSVQPSSGGVFGRNIDISIPTIELQASVNNTTVKTKISYSEKATEGLDVGYDIGNFDGSAFDVFTHLVDGSLENNFTHQSLPTDTMENAIIPLGVKAKEGSEIEFTSKMIALPSGIEIYIEDRLLNEYVKLSETETYTVQLKEAVNGVGRFYLYAKSKTLEVPTFSLDDIRIYNSKSTVFVEGIISQDFELVVYDLLGKVVYKNNHQGTGKNSIVLPPMEQAIYVAQVRTEVGVKDKKILIKK
ncbi:MBG domain-containing protein [Tenacibaculum agarivorans]|uniref:MBG domain-containing protein n=1 Tax=Tenacibaculum agarivorans TaxID=1908389 RepID=UPI0009F9E939|nr:MBG domain-containing protein [Tenacibaculum agarivorans]